MIREEAIQILQLYRDEIRQRLDKVDSPDVKDVYQLQMDGFDMAIEALSAEAGWIPCSERLPNYREAVLVSTFWGVRMGVPGVRSGRGGRDMTFVLFALCFLIGVTTGLMLAAVIEEEKERKK